MPSGVTFGLNSVQNTGYADNQASGWYGYNLSRDEGTAYGACEKYQGGYTLRGIGGGAKLTSSAPKGLYLIATELNLLNEGGTSGGKVIGHLEFARGTKAIHQAILI